MSEEGGLRWRFHVVDIPKPRIEGTAYKWAFLGLGISCGALWENLMVEWLGQRWGSVAVFTFVAVTFVWQGIYMNREHKRIQKLVEETREMMKQRGIPEAPEAKTGDASHNGRGGE